MNGLKLMFPDGARSQRTRRRPAYLLVELMIVLSLLAAVAIVASRLLVVSMTASRDAQTRAETADRFDLAMSRLRADVWSSQRIEADDSSVTLQQADGRKITWRIEPRNADAATNANPDPAELRVNLLRHDGSEIAAAESPEVMADMRWTDLPQGMAFTASGSMLRVRIPGADDSDSSDRLTMVSQLQLAGRTP